MYKVVVRGVEVHCATLDEVQTLLNFAIRTFPTGTFTCVNCGPSKATPPSREERVKAFLRTIEEAGPKGIDSSILSERLGLSGPRGLGVIYGMVKNHLASNGRDVTAIIERYRTGDGERRWAAKDQDGVQLAMQSVEEALAK